jgi:membrane protease subunit HflK
MFVVLYIRNSAILDYLGKSMTNSKSTTNNLDNNPWGEAPKKRPSAGQGSNDNANLQNPLEDLFKVLKKKMSNGGGKNNGGDNQGKSIIFIVLVIAFIWGLTGIYTIQTDEEGLILRFGKFNRIATPGLNYHLPVPFETIKKVKVTAINKLEVGYRSGTGRRGVSDSNHTEESLMLTGDENIVDIHFEVQWKVKKAYDYVFNIRDLEKGATVKSAAESAMREVIGKTPIALALAEGRLQVEDETKELLQNILDSYSAGIEVVRLQMLKVDPPSQVIDAFRDVQTAKADKEREINQAEAYRKDIIPRARGGAEQIIQDAQAYKESVVADAQGKSARFLNVYREYAKAKYVTRKRMYLQAMESVLQAADVTIVDGNASKNGVVPYLPLTALGKTNN